MAASGVAAAPRSQALAEAAALARGQDGERAAQERQDVRERVRADLLDPVVEDLEELGVVDEHEAARADEALDPGGAALGLLTG